MTPEQKDVARANLAKARAYKSAKAAAGPETASSAAIQAANAAPPAVDVAALFKAIADLSAEVAALRSAPLAQPPANPAGPRLPPGANPYEFLPLEGALKEALFEMGAVDRRTNAVRTSRLAAHIAARGFPKSRGRTYEGDEHAHEVCINLNTILQQNKRLGMSAPLIGWFHYVGGQAAGSPDNFEWMVPQPAIAEAAAQGRTIVSAPGGSAAPETPLRPALAGGAAYAEDMLPGKRTADQVMASMPKLETQELGRIA